MTNRLRTKLRWTTLALAFSSMGLAACMVDEYESETFDPVDGMENVGEAESQSTSESTLSDSCINATMGCFTKCNLACAKDGKLCGSIRVASPGCGCVGWTCRSLSSGPGDPEDTDTEGG